MLDLRWNQLTVIPSDVTMLSNLSILELSENLITSIPEHITHLTKLRILELNQNQLTTIPDHISSLSLNEMGISANNIPSTEHTKIRTLLPGCKIHF